MNWDNVKSRARNVDGKSTFKFVLWGCAIFFVLYFFGKIMSKIQELFGASKGSAEEEKKLNIQNQWFSREKQGFNWKLAGITQAQAEQKALEAVGYMSGWVTDWSSLSKLVISMNATQFIGFYLAFGSRLNDEFRNTSGDFIEWVNKEASNSIIAFGTTKTPIQFYLNKNVIPFIKTNQTLKDNLNRINNG